MGRRLGLCAVFMFLVMIAAACGGSSATDPASTPADEGAETEPTEGTTGEFEEMTLNLGHAIAADETSHYHQGALKFKEIVEEETGGKVTIEIHPNSALGGEREMIEGLQLGTLDMVFTSSGPVGNFAPLSNAFDFPFLFRDREHAYAVLDGEIGAEVAEQLEGVGIKLLAWAENGFRMITNNRRAIVNPEDMQGISLRTMENQIHIQAFEDYGGNPTPMAFNELYTAMQQGVVDGQENPLAVIIPSKFYEIQNHLTLSSHVYSPAPLLISKALYDDFPPELQDIFVRAAEEMRDWEREFIADLTEQYIQTALDEGMEIVSEEEFNYEAFFEATQGVYELYQDEYGEIHERIWAVE
ncbi:TRAP transporter substrate-binding protein [Alkalihalobacillus oceani]|uniref:TRAP transporter substrate-binding protein n=1 Tax=Halalkalibacter oceani TaxID=1653776 RepID=UPI00203BB023|nr:TRAP transporter substrate-binding protein [Halalkalibacter oceani]